MTHTMCMQVRKYLLWFGIYMMPLLPMLSPACWWKRMNCVNSVSKADFDWESMDEYPLFGSIFGLNETASFRFIRLTNSDLTLIWLYRKGEWIVRNSNQSMCVFMIINFNAFTLIKSSYKAKKSTRNFKMIKDVRKSCCALRQ